MTALQQRTDVLRDGRINVLHRDGIEAALDLHHSEGRILRWGRNPDRPDGHVIGMANGSPLATRNLRETAIFVLGLASAHQGDERIARQRARLAAARNPES